MAKTTIAASPDGDILETDAVIANGATTSGTVQMGNYKLCGIGMPAALTGTTITIKKVSNDGTARTVQNGGTSVDQTITFGASDYAPLDPTDFLGVDQVQIVSSATEGGERTFELVGTKV